LGTSFQAGPDYYDEDDEDLGEGLGEELEGEDTAAKFFGNNDSNQSAQDAQQNEIDLTNMVTSSESSDESSDEDLVKKTVEAQEEVPSPSQIAKAKKGKGIQEDAVRETREEQLDLVMKVKRYQPESQEDQNILRAHGLHPEHGRFHGFSLKELIDREIVSVQSSTPLPVLTFDTESKPYSEEKAPLCQAG
jgi:hypothetical protein